MAPDTTENWWTVGSAIGTVLGAIAFGFSVIYQRARKETGPGEGVGTAIGAAFVDRSAAQSLVRIAENTDKMLDIMEDREKRFQHGELMRELEEKLAKKKQVEDH